MKYSQGTTTLTTPFRERQAPTMQLLGDAWWVSSLAGKYFIFDLCSNLNESFPRDRASPSVIGVGGAVFRSVPSLEIGRQVVQAALSAGSCMLLP